MSFVNVRVWLTWLTSWHPVAIWLEAKGPSPNLNKLSSVHLFQYGLCCWWASKPLCQKQMDDITKTTSIYYTVHIILYGLAITKQTFAVDGWGRTEWKLQQSRDRSKMDWPWIWWKPGVIRLYKDPLFKKWQCENPSFINLLTKPSVDLKGRTV